MQRGFDFSVGEFYHVYNRGNGKRVLFLDDRDYQRFLFILFVCNSETPINMRDDFPTGIGFDKLENFFRDKSLVNIGAYCLMPNHFHLLLGEKKENGISKFLRKLGTAYSMYFNTKYERKGKLFEGPFRATHAHNDNYLKYLFAYIHLNPVKLIEPKWKVEGLHDKVKVQNFLKDYHYSSFPDYIGKSRAEAQILERANFPEYFAKTSDFESYLKDWLEFNDAFSPRGLS